MKFWLILAFVALTWASINAAGTPDCTAAIPTFTGHCRTFLTGYYFNAATDSCVRIHGSGCTATTDNYFPNKQICLKTCATGLL